MFPIRLGVEPQQLSEMLKEDSCLSIIRVPILVENVNSKRRMSAYAVVSNWSMLESNLCVRFSHIYLECAASNTAHDTISRFGSWHLPIV